jgi:hypothetical protein
MHPAFPFFIGPAAGILAFIGASVLVACVVATFGWSRFASRHGTTLPAGEPRCTAYSVRFTAKPMAYNNVVQLSFLPEGLRFGMPMFFRSGHSPFLLPYSSVREVRRKSGWLREHLEVRLEADEGIIRMRLPPSAQAMFAARGVQARPALRESRAATQA